MRTSSSRRVRRALASFLAAALAAGLTVAGTGAPAQASAADVTGGSATWNFVDSWTSYVTGGIAQGTITPPLQGGQASYGPASGSYDDASGTGSVRLGGSTRYEGHHGALDVTISDVRLDLTGPTTGAVYADFAGTVNPGAGNDVKVADVTVSATRAGDEVTFVADGSVVGTLGNVSPYFSSYAGKPLSTLTARVVSPEPVAPAQATTTTLVAAPAGTSAAGASVTLTATVAPAAAGTVEFRDGGTALGTGPVADGVARLETTALAPGSHQLSAAFTPTDPAAFVASTSAAVAHTVTAKEPEPGPEPELEPAVEPAVTVSPSTPVDPAVENTFTISGTGFVGAGAANGAYVLLGDAAIWDGSGPLVASGWLAQGWVMPQQVRDGAFTTTLTVPAGKLDPAKQYVVATSAAHGLSVTDRSLDTFTPVAVQGSTAPEPVWEPQITLYAADGTTPLGDAPVRPDDRIVVKGSGFDPAANVAPAGNRPPISGGIPAGTYVVFGSFAADWRPSEGAPSSARTAGSQQWALSSAALDQVDPRYQPAIRGQWAELAPDGTFTAELVAGELEREDGRYGVYTYAAGGTVNAAQELYAPVAFTTEPEAPVWEPEIAVLAADGTTPLGDTPVAVGDTIVVRGTGFDPAANVGGRGVPIPATLPQGTYVVFGSFAEQWRPSEGAASSTRKVGSQAWALAEPVLDQVPAQYQSVVRAQWADITPDGTFEARLVVKNPAALEGGRYGVATYGAGGVSNAAQELFVPVAYDAPGTLTVTPASTTVEAGSTVRLAVRGLAADDAVKVVTFGGAPASYSRDGATLVLAVPAGTPAGPVPVVVTSELGRTGSATLTVTTKPVVVPPVDPQPTVPTSVGSLTWGVRGSFVDYIEGPIAKGDVAVSSGAARDGSVFAFGQSTPWAAPATGTTAGYHGTVRFSGHGGLLHLTVSEPRVRIDGPRSATLVLDVSSRNLDGTTFAKKGVAFATLSLPAPSTAKDGAVTYRAAAATLTAAGSAAFSGFYAAGDPLAPVTFTVGAASTAPGGGGGGTEVPAPGGTTDLTTATLSVAQARPGDEVTISGVGFGAGESGIRTELRSTPRTLATGTTANAGGAATSTVTIPNDVAPGEHTLLLIGAGHTASAPLTIVGAGTTGTGTGSGSAAEQCFAQGVDGATLSWGVSDRFRSYVTGPIAKGSVATDGVRDGGSAFTWSGGKGSFNTDLGKGRASFGGSVSFSGHEGILDLRISNPRVVVDGSSGTLVVDVQSSDMEGKKSSSTGVAFASLDLSGKKSTSGSTITWSGVPATLTAAGAKAFAGFYEAGTALSPVTVSLPVGGDVECDAYSGALATTGSDAGSLALLAGTLLLTGAALLAVRRRRAGRVEMAAAA
ncbi:HtaA domain-containing protein [Cellulosimicrobium cellulans]|uniref:HtaA domain-containing protein n=1 Tax=Cellulosimicrobium cellulans TaxID=1710 RepID=UPI0020CCF031|nr:HtaA domain-containing protein [Cellulosimicrobium cellulans]